MKKDRYVKVDLTPDEAQFVIDVLVNLMSVYHVVGGGRNASPLVETIRWKLNHALDQRVLKGG